MIIVPEASATNSLAAEHPLWSARIEQPLVEESMLATIYCKKRCGFSEKAFFRGKDDKCPKCKSRLAVDVINGRNSVVSNKTEDFALQVLASALRGLQTQLEREYFAKRGVNCPELGLTGNSGADLAILTQNLDGPIPASMIKCLFEVKMSFIWNWHKKDMTNPVSDYDGHQGRPSIFRTDSVLKAIGKATITRSYKGSERIPFIVIGNTPPPTGYRPNIDKTVSSGLIQKWISLTPNPLVVKPQEGVGKRNPKATTGFLRIDKIEELQKLLFELLTGEGHYMSAMVEAEKIGRLILSLDLNGSPERIGQEFLQRLPEASVSSKI